MLSDTPHDAAHVAKAVLEGGTAVLDLGMTPLQIAECLARAVQSEKRCEISDSLQKLLDALEHILNTAMEPRYADHFIGRMLRNQAEELRKWQDEIEPIKAGTETREREDNSIETNALMLELCNQLGAKDGESMTDMLFAAVRDALLWRARK